MAQMDDHVGAAPEEGGQPVPASVEAPPLELELPLPDRAPLLLPLLEPRPMPLELPLLDPEPLLEPMPLLDPEPLLEPMPLPLPDPPTPELLEPLLLELELRPISPVELLGSDLPPSASMSPPSPQGRMSEALPPHPATATLPTIAAMTA